MDEVIQFAQAVLDWLSQHPWVLLGCCALPLFALAFRLRVYPTWLWLAILGTSVVLSVLAIPFQGMLPVLVVIDGLFLIVATLDAAILISSTSRGIHASRQLPQTASLGQRFVSEVTIVNQTPLALNGRLRDDWLPHFEITPEDHSLRLAPLNQMTARRELISYRRGAFVFESVYLELSSPLRLWQRHQVIPVSSRLKVFPNMKQLSDYALLARTNRLSLIGVHQTRRIGQDSDFERLRDYSRDDNYRHIDWRSTARRRKLTVRQFQTDQSQRVVFLLDCGRMMTGQRDGYSLFDHALNAALMMAYVALVQGDAVGMLCFSDAIHAYIPPRGGSTQMNRLIQAGFDQFPRFVESRHDSAFLYLSSHCKRRSLVVLMTNVIDEVNAASVVDYLSNLTGRHLPLGVMLRDREMFDAADNPDGDPMKMYRAAAAADILVWRHQVLTNLEHGGVLVVDAFPDELTAPLVNRYLEIKAKHLL
jgi:uncharacterized protein (DUF58 family)